MCSDLDHVLPVHPVQRPQNVYGGPASVPAQGGNGLQSLRHVEKVKIVPEIIREYYSRLLKNIY